MIKKIAAALCFLALGVLSVDAAELRALAGGKLQFAQVTPLPFLTTSSASALTNAWFYCNTPIVGKCTNAGSYSSKTNFQGGAAHGTIVNKFTFAIGGGAGKIQFVFAGPASGSTIVSAMYVGLSQTSGSGHCANASFCPYDFQSSPIVPVTFNNGSSSVTMTGGTTVLYTSDIISFDPSGLPFALSADINSTSLISAGVDSQNNTTPGTPALSINGYFRSSITQEAASASKLSNYTSLGAGGFFFLKQILIQ